MLEGNSEKSQQTKILWPKNERPKMLHKRIPKSRSHFGSVFSVGCVHAAVTYDVMDGSAAELCVGVAEGKPRWNMPLPLARSGASISELHDLRYTVLDGLHEGPPVLHEQS